MNRYFQIAVCVLASALCLSTDSAACVDYTDVTRWVATPRITDDQFVVDGDQAYFAGIGGFDVVDVHDPCRMFEVGHCNGDFHGVVAVRGTHAYVRNPGAGIAVIDIADRKHPAVVGLVPAELYFLPADVVGDGLCVTYGAAEVLVYDLTDPVNPALAATFLTSRPVRGLQQAGDLLYVLDDDLEIFDVSDPAAPRRVGIIDTPGRPDCVAVDGSFVYVNGYGLAGLYVYDATEPASPVEVWQQPGIYGRMVISDDVLYLARSDINLFDIRDPHHPRRTGIIDLPEGIACMAIVGRWLLASGFSELYVMSLASPEIPGPDAIVEISDGVIDFAVVDDIAYAATIEGLCVIYIGDPGSGQLLTCLPLGFDAESVAAADDRVYVLGHRYEGSTSFSGLSIVDVSTHQDPSLISTTELRSSGRSLAVAGDVLYAALYMEGLAIVDMHSPDNPSVAYRDDLPGFVNSVAVSGRHLFVGGSGFLQIYSLEDPLDPRLVSSVEEGECGNNLVVTPTKVLTGSDDVCVFDISDLRDPRFDGLIATPSFAGDVCVTGDFAYCCDALGLAIIDLASLAGPELIGYVDVPGLAWHGAIAGDHLVVNGGGGLAFMPLQCESTVSLPRPTLTTWPNPLHDEANVRFTLARGGRIAARVYDVAGRLIRTFFQGDAQPGTVSLQWDSRDDDGRRVPAGVYLIRVESGEGAWTSKVVRVR